MKQGTTDWLLAGPAWVEYRTRIDLLGQSENDPEVTLARTNVLSDPQVKTMLGELAGWPGASLKRHNDAGHLLHKLVFLADLGLQSGDPILKAVIETILARQSYEGAFQILINIPKQFGGSGQEEWQWVLCDAPSILYALLKFGLEVDPRIQMAGSHLAGLVRENGWPCAAASGLGKFHGPGRRDDPCPYATLIALKALAQSAQWRESKACQVGAQALLNLWEHRKERKPYLFGMGTDFAKLKAPLVWYDLLHTLDVLSQFPWLKGDHRLEELAAFLASKADEQGRFTPQSIWMAWKGWEFTQKKEPSRWMTLIAQRSLRRLNEWNAVL